MPSTLSGARKEDLEAHGEGLVAHLAEAAALRSAADAPEHVRRRANVAALVGAWPPSDKALSSLLKALGATAAAAASGEASASAGRGALYSVACAEPAVRRGLQSFAKAARHKCSGRVLDGLGAVLRDAQAHATDGESGDDDDDDDNGREERVAAAAAAPAPRRKRRADRQVEEGGEGAFACSEAMERCARQALNDLKHARALYASAELPTLRAAEGGPARRR